MMPLVRTALSVTVLLLLGGGAAAPAPNVPDFAKKLPEYKSGDPVFSFNGKDLTGWYTFLRDHKHEDPEHVFSVENGMIHITGGEFGGMTTKDTFKNYHLVAEWKWGDKQFDLIDDVNKSITRLKTNARDAGILVHAVGEDGAAYRQWMESIEVQIIEGGVGDFLLVPGKRTPSMTAEGRVQDKQFYFEPGNPPKLRKGGRINWWGRDPMWKDVSGYRGPREVESPHGEWNRLDVICDGDKISTILNGYLVNEATKSSHAEGKIQLQSEGAEIFFRKVEVRPLIK